MKKLSYKWKKRKILYQLSQDLSSLIFPINKVNLFLSLGYNRIQPVKNGFERPVIIHRAIFGSLERFIAILCEHTGGKWDFWVSPRQLKIIPIGKDHVEFAEQVLNTLVLQGFSVEIDYSSDKLDKKIRNAQMESFNYIGVIGQK
jgi:threonyl-tRNA synthetase